MKPEKSVPKWLLWAREIQALSQTGLTYAENDFDQERYQRLGEISAEMISENSNLGAQEILEDFEQQKGYATPKVDLRGAVFKDGQLLMVRERADGTWAMPGGWADVGDMPSAGTEREILEETGIKAKAIKLIAVYDANRFGDLNLHHAFKLMFLCDYIEGEPTISNETTEVRYFQRDEIPEALLGPRTSAKQIDDAFAINENRSLPAIFN